MQSAWCFILAGSAAAPLSAQATWAPANRVEPQVTVDIKRDNARGLWIYNYTVLNGAMAQQPIAEMIIGRGSTGITARAPAGWIVTLVPESVFVGGQRQYRKNRQVIPFEVEAPWDETSGALRADRVNIVVRPGTKRSGFVLESADPPGLLTVYVRGFTALVHEDELPDPLPDWLADAKKLVVRGPVRRP